MSDQVLRPKREMASIQLGPEQNDKLDLIAERFGVSRTKAAQWVINDVDPLTFAPSGRTVSTIETMPEGAAV